MGVAIDYLYRDGSNNKVSGRVVFRGELTEELGDRLQATLDDGKFFVADQVSVPELFTGLSGYEPIPGVDHCWHEVCGVSATTEAPNHAWPFIAAVAAFEQAARDGWQEFDPAERASRRVNGVERTEAEDRWDVLTGAQDLEGGRAAEMMRTVGEPVKAAGRAHFTIDTRAGFVLLEDRGTGMSITNAAEEVVAQLATWGSLKDGRRVLYRDTSGQWDELLHHDGRFSGFAPIGARTPEAAMARARERERIRELVVRRQDHSVLVPGPVSEQDLKAIEEVAVETRARVVREEGGVALACGSLAALDFAQRRLCAELDCRSVEAAAAARQRTNARQGRSRSEPFER